VPADKYDLIFEPGFWDTHNKSTMKNVLGNLLNPVVRLSGKAGIRVAPFIYVIAVPKVNRLIRPQIKKGD
jgi:hypothetical protein